MKDRPARFLNKIGLYLGAAMVLFYIGAGALMAFTDHWKDNFPKEVRVLFGGALIAYGIFRAYRLYKNLKANEDEE